MPNRLSAYIVDRLSSIRIQPILDVAMARFEYEERLRDFFVYRDLGVAAATRGRVIAQIAKANTSPITEQAGTSM
jgi:predicted YcjX-like family ATPase